MENIALTYMMTLNVEVIILVASFFTAILSHLFARPEGKFTVNFLWDLEWR